LVLTSGCADYFEDPPPQCDASRRCFADDLSVCGTDGQTYQCALYAQCLGVEIDPTGAACCDGDCTDNCDNGNCIQCPNVDPADCDHGTELDDNGCTVCKAAPDCQPVVCTLYCPNGFATDADGCEVCECAQEDCPTVQCANDCPNGYVVDEQGCQTCDCKPPVCEPVDPDCTSDPACTVQNVDGCDTCVCASDQCPRMFCNNDCPNGYKIEDGCPTCECADPCADLPECDLACFNGNKTDRWGCVHSCECRDECDPVACDIRCEYGLARDESGCQICECAAKPCTSDDACAPDEMCVYAPSTLDSVPPGHCREVETCSAPDFACDEGQCSFVHRGQCCPPMTSCAADVPACPTFCVGSSI